MTLHAPCLWRRLGFMEFAVKVVTGKVISKKTRENQGEGGDAVYHGHLPSCGHESSINCDDNIRVAVRYFLDISIHIFVLMSSK